MESEISFVLEAAGELLDRAPTRADVLSVFAGIRPLAAKGSHGNTASLSRDHVVHVDRSGLVTICGGKWTTYRRMAEDCVNQAAAAGGLARRRCTTHNLKIHGACELNGNSAFAVYGSDEIKIRKLIVEDPHLGDRLHPDLPYVKAEVIWAVREEMARTMEDVLARRTRALFLDARAALATAQAVAELMASQLGWNEAMLAQQLSAFQDIASGYVLPS